MKQTRVDLSLNSERHTAIPIDADWEAPVSPAQNIANVDNRGQNMTNSDIKKIVRVIGCLWFLAMLGMMGFAVTVGTYRMMRSIVFDHKICAVEEVR